MNEGGCCRCLVGSSLLLKGEREESHLDLHLLLPCNPACLWPSVCQACHTTPFSRAAEAKGENVCSRPTCCRAHGTHSQPRGGQSMPERSWPTALPVKLLGLACWSELLMSSHQWPLVVSEYRARNLRCELWLKGLPFWNLLCWRSSGKAQLALGLWRRWHHQAKVQGSRGALLCVCPGVPGRQLWGDRGRAAPSERGTMTCDVCLLLLLACVSHTTLGWRLALGLGK